MICPVYKFITIVYNIYIYYWWYSLEIWYSLIILTILHWRRSYSWIFQFSFVPTWVSVRHPGRRFRDPSVVAVDKKCGVARRCWWKAIVVGCDREKCINIQTIIFGILTNEWNFGVFLKMGNAKACPNSGKFEGWHETVLNHLSSKRSLRVLRMCHASSEWW